MFAFSFEIPVPINLQIRPNMQPFQVESYGMRYNIYTRLIK